MIARVRGAASSSPGCGFDMGIEMTRNADGATDGAPAPFVRQHLSRRERRVLFGILAVALILRGAWCLYAAEPPVIGDPVLYYINGAQIAEGHGYSNAFALLGRVAEMRASGSRVLPGHDVPSAIGPPGYPATLGALFWLVIHSPLPDNPFAAAVALNVALGVATVLMAFELMRRVFDTQVALVGAALLAVYPNLIFHAATLHYETTFIFVTMAALLVLLGRPWPGGRVPPRRLVAFAVLLGLSVLIRPTAAPIVLVLFVIAVIQGATVRLAFAQCGVVVGVVGLMLLPWTIRNIVKLHSPVVVSTGYGPALCMSRHPGARGDNAGHGSPQQAKKMARYCLPSLAGVPLRDQEVKVNNYAMSRAVKFVVEHPFEEVRLWLPRSRYAYREDHDALEDVAPFVARSTRQTLARVGDWFYFAILGLSAVGVASSARRAAPARLFLVLATLALAVNPIVLYGAPRYKVPATPFFAMMAAVGLVVLARRLAASPTSTPGGMRSTTTTPSSTGRRS